MFDQQSPDISSGRSTTLDEMTRRQEDDQRTGEDFEKRREDAAQTLSGDGNQSLTGEVGKSGDTPSSRTIGSMIRHVVTYSWVNVLMIFVPAGVAVAQIDSVHGGIVFALNCIAVIPLAGLLAHATETVAADMGDSLGALMNVTFGNAVELIILIALIKNKIRIVQASLLGSILANLLLILGMSFFLGGMRYREQLYNSTVTQMSACLLSLSVISLVLPTAFHASFSNHEHADEQSLKISRGTSVVLLLVYIIFVVFQLKSHSFMYKSTPRHIIDAEAAPGPVAAWLEAYDPEYDDDCSCTDSDCTLASRNPVSRRVKSVLRPIRSRKTSRSRSRERSGEMTRNSSVTAASINQPARHDADEYEMTSASHMEGISAVDTAESHGHQMSGRRRSRRYRHGRGVKSRRSKRSKGHRTGTRHGSGPILRTEDHPPRLVLSFPIGTPKPGEHDESEAGPSPFWAPLVRFRNMTPTALSGGASHDVPQQNTEAGMGHGATTSHHSNGVLGRLTIDPSRGSGAMLPSGLSARAMVGGLNAQREAAAGDTTEREEPLSRAGAVVLLVITTSLVAMCAEFLVSSIEDVTGSTSIGETFIGLIVLPIVGNGAEHITSIKVAMKNKMDLAIGVAIGSSIQIALLITPLVVLLGWAIEREMSLYFPLFEMVCMFASAFIVNFLVLDGRSNYMEGALLCAVYVIIGVVAFFYPEGIEQNPWNEGEELPGDRHTMMQEQW